MKREIRTLVPAVLFLSTSLAAHAAEPAVGLLLRLQDTVTDSEAGTSGSAEELIYHDGLVLSRSIPSEQFPSVTYWRAKAPPEAMQKLKAALAANRVGLIQAPPHCGAVNPNPTFVSYTTDLTWFGKKGRQNRLSFGSVGVEPCPQEINNVVNAIKAFSGKLVFQDVVTTQP
jgi:hypothetical protein